MRVLITGAAGFVGRHLAEHLMAGGHDVVGVGHATDQQLAHDYVAVDLRAHEAARATFATVDPEWVFHLAAEASVAQSWQDPRGTIRNNLESTFNVLEAARGARVLLAGSGEIYGPPRELPVTEDHAHAPQNPYASSKDAAERMASFHSEDVH